jgi:hypothetical protein
MERHVSSTHLAIQREFAGLRFPGVAPAVTECRRLTLRAVVSTSQTVSMPWGCNQGIVSDARGECGYPHLWVERARNGDARGPH